MLSIPLVSDLAKCSVALRGNLELECVGNDVKSVRPVRLSYKELPQLRLV